MDTRKFASICDALESQGFDKQAFRPEDERWSWAASWKPTRPKISVWYGDFINDFGESVFWVGFQVKEKILLV